MSTIILALPIVQTTFAEYATDRINKDYGTSINIERLKVSLISGKAHLKGVFVQDYQKDTLFFVNDLSTSILSVNNLVKGKLEFGAVAIDELVFKLKTYEGNSNTNLDVFIAKLDSGKERDSLTPPFFLSSSDVTINNSVFKLVNENFEKQKILDFKDVNITSTDFQILGPQVSTGIETLSFNSSRGISVSNLKTKFKYTKQQMRFDSLDLKTKESNLTGGLVFNYERKDFANFLDKVNVQAEFIESTVALNEINNLYNEFGENKIVNFSSSFNGVLNDLNMEKLFLQTNNTGIRGDFNFKNLFSKRENFKMTAKMKNVTSSYYEMRALMPRILGNSLPSSFKKLGQFTVRGNTTVTLSDIEAKVNLNTNIGSSYADVLLSDIQDIDNATYKGFISLIDFDLGSFVEKESLGKTTLDFNIEGKGFVTENLNTEVIGDVYSITFNDYTYKEIKVSGVLKEQLFDGSLVSNDPNLKFRFNGLADFEEGRNNFNFKAAVAYANLKNLNFIKDSISIFKGKVDMDITGNSLDNVVGDIKFTKTSFENKNSTYYFDDFKISSSFERDTIRTIAINSPDIITGYIKGDFKVRELGKVAQNSLGSIYTNYRPFKVSKGQKLSFNFKIYNKIVDVFFPEVKFDPNTFIKGEINADDGDLKLNFKSPSIVAFGNEADQIDLKIDNKNPLFNTFVSVGDLSTPYYDVKDFNLINTTLKDTLFFRAEFKGGSEYNDSYNLNFYHTFNKSNKSVIGLKTSDLSFKGNKWVLNKNDDANNKVILNRTLDSITIKEIVMNNNKDEQIRLKGHLADSTYKDLELKFNLVSLNKITPEIDSLKLQGQVNGILNVLQKDNIYLPSSNLEIENFGINDIPLGDLTVGIIGNRDLTDFVVNSQITENGVQKLGIVGNVLNTGKTPQANLLVNFSAFKIHPFSPLGRNVIGNIRGDLSGSARLTGPVNNPEINGLLSLNNAGISIPYLNVDYDFAPDSKVRLYEQTFEFENIGLSDVSENTRGSIDGTISHKYFDNWVLDLDVNTNNDRLLILNTEFDEEQLFYGTGFLNGTGRIYGPTTALNIDVLGSTARGTSLKIPLSDVASVGDYSFINFVSKNERLKNKKDKILKDYQGLELKFDLDITPDAEVEIVTDQKTKSSLKGTGVGTILMQINTRGKFEMFGDYVVVTGEYHHKFGGVIDKTFTVKPGGTIVWEREPLEALLNMEAVYSLYANPAPLLDNAGSSTSRILTDVVIRLSEELQSPNIDFQIEFPSTNSIIQSELEYALQDPTIEEKNALFLLAQGSFVNDQTGINQQAVTGNLLQSASGLLNQMLGGDNDKLNFGLSYEQGYIDSTTDSESDDRIGLTVSTKISDRVLFNGNFGVPVGGSSETVVAGDAEIQLLLNEEGTLSAKFFNRQNEIQDFLADNQGYTQGAGLSYEVDFDNFKELFRKILGKDKTKKSKKKKKKEPNAVMGKDSLIRFYSKSQINPVSN